MLNLKTTEGLNLKLVQIIPIPKTLGLPELLFICIDPKEGIIYKVKESEVASVGK